ncbi:MAG: S49 family peptidase [Flavobacteriales bacterium]
MSYKTCNNYPNLAARAFNQPLLMEPGYARVFFSSLSDRLGIKQLQDVNGRLLCSQNMRTEAEEYENSRESVRSYQVINGIAILPVSGTLVHKYSYMQPHSGMTGYNGIIQRLNEAVADHAVDGVLLDIDSPGGEVLGCFDCTDIIHALGQIKPVAALCYDMNCSAAMAIASATGRRYITQTGVAGSVGVLLAHCSHEKALEEEGLKVTLIHSGAHKVDGNPYFNLKADVVKEFQEQVDKTRLMFAEKVAKYMRMGVQDILNTEAATYTGQDAIKIGLADELVNGFEAVNVFREYVTTQHKNTAMGAEMGRKEQYEDQETLTKEQAEKVAAELVTAERERIKSITTCKEAEGRRAMAEHLAFNTDLSVDSAKSLLNTAPQEKQQQDSNPLLDAAMNATHKPVVSSDADYEQVSGDDAVIEQALSAYSTITGIKHGE